MIKLQIIGNLGDNCAVKEVNGKNVINFNVAHSEKFKDAQGVQKERTTWVNCAYWTDRLAIAPYLTKGTTVYAEGSPEADGYTNRDGQPAATLRMRVMNIQLLGGANRNDGNAVNTGNVSNISNTVSPVVNTETQSSASIAPDDDLPF